MAARNVVLLVAALSGLAFAGCIGESDDAPPQDTEVDAGSDTGPAPAAAPTPTLGSVVGTVVDMELVPIPGAFVVLAAEGPERAARTDDAGRYTINDIAPGRWPLQVSGLGWETVLASAEVVAGAVTTVDFQLEEFWAPDPFSVRFETRGFMAYGAATYNGELAAAPDLGDPNHDTTHDFEIATEGLESLLVEVYWQDATTGLEIDLWKNVTCNPCSAEYEYANARGWDSIKVRLDRPAAGWEGMTLDKELLWVFVWPTSDDEHPASVTYQEPYDVYFEAFYRKPAPVGYSVRGDH